MHFFPDSNFFFQFKDARELDWSLVTDANEIKLHVARTVHQEIDRHKGGGNARRADRARKTSSLLRSVLESPNNGVVYREANPRVTLKLAPRLDPNREKYDTLDLTQPDDRLIEEVLSHKKTHGEADVALLTDDGPAMGTAREMGLDYVAIPDEWRLPPEPSAEAKEIADLRRRLTTLEKTNPVLELKARAKDGTEIRKLEIEYVQYQPMTLTELARVMTEVNRLHSVQKDFPEPQNKQRGGGAVSSYPGIFEKSVWKPPSEHVVSRYQAKHDEWRRELEKSLRDYHTYLNSKQNIPDVHFDLVNTGSLPANDLAINFDCAGGLLLDFMRKYKGKRNGGLRLPPSPPTGAYVSLRGLRGDVYGLAQAMALPNVMFPGGLPSIVAREGLLRHEPDDPYAFYYHPKHKEASEGWELRCQQFRHQLEAEDFGWCVRMCENLMETRGVIRVRVTASNVPTPVSLNLPVHIRMQSISPLDEALAAIDPTVLALNSSDGDDEDD